jgi:hypothetical protein
MTEPDPWIDRELQAATAGPGALADENQRLRAEVAGLRQAAEQTMAEMEGLASRLLCPDDYPFRQAADRLRAALAGAPSPGPLRDEVSAENQRLRDAMRGCLIQIGLIQGSVASEAFTEPEKLRLMLGSLGVLSDRLEGALKRP